MECNIIQAHIILVMVVKFEHFIVFSHLTSTTLLVKWHKQRRYYIFYNKKSFTLHHQNVLHLGITYIITIIIFNIMYRQELTQLKRKHEV